MVDFSLPNAPTPVTHADDPRLGQLFGTVEPAVVEIVGFPSDDGVRVNGGRVGAHEAPDRIRALLYKMTPDPRFGDRFATLAARVRDAGNAVIMHAGSLASAQESFAVAVDRTLTAGRIPIILGGGHETAYAHFLGYVFAGTPVSILNWDAHPDVRPLKNGYPHSGSPFRQALEHESQMCRHYTVAGLLPHSTASAHVDYVRDHGGTVVWRDALSRRSIDGLYDALDGPTMVTFDLDAVDQAHAPGVSAPAAGGMSVDLWLHAAYRAGTSNHVHSMDVVELNPRLDLDNRTANLAALTVWHFLRGLAERGIMR